MLMGLRVVREVGSDKKITPVRFSKRDRAIELVQCPFAQFQDCKLKPLKLHLVELLQKRQVVAAFLEQSSADKVSLLQREQKRDAPLCFGTHP